MRSLVLLLVIALFFMPFHEGAKPISPAVVVMAAGQQQQQHQQQQPKKKNGLISFLSGGLAGTISSTVTLPLEVVKMQLQSSRFGSNNSPLSVCRMVMAQDGPKGFFKGLQPMLLGIIPTRAIYFWAYQGSKERLEPIVGNTPLNHLASAFAAGITSNTIMNPFWMVKTRFQILADKSVGQTHFTSYGQIIKSVYATEGIAGFWKGVSASYVGCFEGAAQWIAYEKAKSVLQARAAARIETEKGTGGAGKSSSSSSSGNSVLQPVEYFLAAAGSKALAVLLTYPHEVVRTRLREQAANGIFKYTGFMPTLRLIAKEEGMRGLYGGMGIHLARSVPNSACMFLAFEVISKLLEKMDGEAKSTTPLSLAASARK